MSSTSVCSTTQKRFSDDAAATSERQPNEARISLRPVLGSRETLVPISISESRVARLRPEEDVRLAPAVTSRSHCLQPPLPVSRSLLHSFGERCPATRDLPESRPCVSCQVGPANLRRASAPRAIARRYA